MQTPALFKPMNLGEGFDDFDFGFSDDSVFYQPDVFDLPIDFPVDTGFDFPVDFGLDLSLPDNIAIVDTSGNVNDQFGAPVISAQEITNIALESPGREGEALAQKLITTSPDWTKQFRSTDDLVKAAYSLFNTSKAVIQGRPIPSSNSPYVYSPDMVRRTTTTAPTSFLTGANSTNILLIGGVALAAFLVLRKK